MIDPREVMFLDLFVAGAVVADLFYVLRKGEARSLLSGPVSREDRPQRFRFYVYSSYAALLFCGAVLVLGVVWPNVLR
jgi:hypothetical protein